MTELGKLKTGAYTGSTWWVHVRRSVSTLLFGSKSLQTKFIIVASAFAIFGMVVMGVMIAKGEKADVYEGIEHQSLLLAETIAITLSPDILFVPGDATEQKRIFNKYVSELFDQVGLRLLYLAVLDERQRVILHNKSLRYGSGLYKHVSTEPVISSEATLVRVPIPETSLEVLDVSVPLVEGSKRWGTLRMAVELGKMRNSMEFFVLKAVGLPLSILVLGLAVIVIFNRRFIKPVSDLAAAMESAGGYLRNVKIEGKGDDEILILSRSFNSMIDRIRKTNQEYMKTHEKLLEFMEKLEPPNEDMLGSKIYVKGSDEVDLLCKRFNSMIDRLQESNRRLVQSQKLASIGILASGVAHEINNPIGGMFNCVKMLEEVGDKEELRHKYHELIKVGLSRIEDIVSKLLLVSRRQESEPSVAEVDNAVDYVLGFIEYKMKRSGITFIQDIQSGISVPLVSLDLQQVFINLMLNSVQAMDEGGSLGIKARENGPKVIIEVSDTGCGISDKDVQKVFDPFYTTKRPGEGTGLGLWLVYEIVKKYNGEISVKSNKGQGTIFTLIFNKA